MDTPPEITKEEEILFDKDDGVDIEKGIQENVDKPDAVDDTIDEGDVDNNINEKADNLEQSQDEIDLEDSDNKSEESKEKIDDQTQDELDDSFDEKTEDSKETDDGKSKEKPKVQKYKLKANGEDFEFTIDELIKLAPKGINYTPKMQEIAPYRRSISAMVENGVSEQDIDLYIEAMKGDKNAISAMLNKAGVDALDLEEKIDVNYSPKRYGKNESEQQIEEIERKISGDDEYAMTSNIVNKGWDSASRDAMFKDPTMIEGLHNDIKSGLYQKIIPKARRLKALGDGSKSDVDYYIEAGQAHALSQKNESDVTDSLMKQETERQENQSKIKDQASKKKAATMTKSRGGKKNVVDYLDENDDKDYDTWYNKVMNSY